jgi:hypothetical protein
MEIKTKFDLGQKVWAWDILERGKIYDSECPDCKGARVYTVKTPSGNDRVLPCDSCTYTYGKVVKLQQEEINCIHVEVSNLGGYSVVISYDTDSNCEYLESHLFLTKEEAERNTPKLIAEVDEEDE